MIHTLERFLEWGGVKKAVTCLVFSGIALLVSIFDLRRLGSCRPLRYPHHLGGSHRPGDSL